MSQCFITLMNMSYLLRRKNALKLMSDHLKDLEELILNSIYNASDDYIDYDNFKCNLITLIMKFERCLRMKAFKTAYTDDGSYIDACKNLLVTIKHTPAKLVFHRLLIRQIASLDEDDPIRFHLVKRIESDDQFAIFSLPIRKAASIWLEFNQMMCERD